MQRHSCNLGLQCRHKGPHVYQPNASVPLGQGHDRLGGARAPSQRDLILCQQPVAKHIAFDDALQLLQAWGWHRQEGGVIFFSSWLHGVRDREPPGTGAMRLRAC
jgi:hypothetical protein